ncbi:hypothetical protein CMO84_04760 [Candidatus Woesearchaeota archaeon]|nr:hypothetical protein [Candidatus Woesearchaeota archaeon]MDP6739554.1 hypothetical protein [Planctomycetota bacterium]MDP6939560.1 hypothetical protein [Planctomycetota bacterium]
MLTGDGERRMEFDFDGADLRDMAGRAREMMADRPFDLRGLLSRIGGGRNDHSEGRPRGLHREEDHDRRDGRDSRGTRQEQHRGMDRPQAFGKNRDMGMMRGRGRGGPDMFPHGEHREGHGELEELYVRIEELEERIEELEALLERPIRRRNR